MTTQTNFSTKIIFAACLAMLVAACGDDGTSSSSPATASAASAGTPPATATIGTAAAGGEVPSTPPVSSTSTAVEAGPVISGTAATTVTVGGTYTFRPTATDATSTEFSFAITGKPAWATFDAATGTLTGVPTAANVGSSPGIQISVSDGTKSAALAPFSIAVVAAANPDDLALTGAPAASATVGTPYSFQPAVTDVAGSRLAYAITNKPVWATFSATTGLLSGSPVTANVGTDAAIEISVSDGTKSAALPAFSIVVTAPPTDSVTLSWTAPSLNVNGTAVTNLAGYHIHYGTSASALSHVIAVDSATDTQQVIANLTTGTWYFAVTSFNSQQVESTMSAVLTVSI